MNEVEAIKQGIKDYLQNTYGVIAGHHSIDGIAQAIHVKLTRKHDTFTKLYAVLDESMLGKDMVGRLKKVIADNI